jgi:hypothetical protein
MMYSVVVQLDCWHYNPNPKVARRQQVSTEDGHCWRWDYLRLSQAQTGPADGAEAPHVCDDGWRGSGEHEPLHEIQQCLRETMGKHDVIGHPPMRPDECFLDLARLLFYPPMLLPCP